MAFFYQEGLSVKIPLNCVKLLCKTGSLSFQVHQWCDLVVITLRAYLYVSVDIYTQEKTQEHFSSFTQQDAKSLIPDTNLQSLFPQVIIQYQTCLFYLFLLCYQCVHVFVSLCVECSVCMHVCMMETSGHCSFEDSEPGKTMFVFTPLYFSGIAYDMPFCIM